MIGIDIVDIKKFGSKKSINQVFTKDELAYAANKANPIESLAGIYALKEAAIKAYDLKLFDILRKKIEIRHIENRPYLYIEGKITNSSVSISHDGDYAIGLCYSDTYMDLDIDLEMAKLLPKRPSKSHKGDYGKIAILGGSAGMAGSVYMASFAAMRTGAGLSYILAPKSISNILQIKATEQIIKEISCDNFYYSRDILDEILENLEDMDVLAIGPGMGKASNLNLLIEEIIKKTNLPMVIDADGLNAISKDVSILKSPNNLILTPHMMEFSRLTGLPLEEITRDKIKVAKDFAKVNGVILVLKSDATIVTDGCRLYENKIGNPGMATAGSGDVLTGIIASLLKLLDPFDAARLGVYIHSLAGDIASIKIGEDSIIASDIIGNIAQAIKKIREIQCKLM